MSLGSKTEQQSLLAQSSTIGGGLYNFQHATSHLDECPCHRFEEQGEEYARTLMRVKTNIDPAGAGLNRSRRRSTVALTTQKYGGPNWRKAKMRVNIRWSHTDGIDLRITIQPEPCPETVPM